MNRVRAALTALIAPAALIGDSPLALMIYPGLPAASLKEFIALAKAKPGTIKFGSSGQPGSSEPS